ncbi:MAG: tetratricopeptide repeat protein [Betaproteobacteria bacterium]|nr:MAG: tetratricopeptide repeat protein [Betaproteobacteria bacterium]
MHLSVPSLGARLAVSTLLVICLAVDHRANAQPADVRTITMRVAADESYRARTDWEAALRNTVQVVSDIYEKHFQVRFVILDIVPLTAGPDASLDHRLAKMVADVPIVEADLLVGFSGGRCEGRPAGGARPFDRFVMIMATCHETEPRKGYGPESVLSHELGHLLGAFHPSISVESVMHAAPPDLFDDQTIRVIRLMRNYDFRQGIMALDEATRRAWRAIYAEGHQRNNEVNPLVSAIANAGVELARSGKPAEGEAALREAIKIDQLLAQPHAMLGTMYARRGLLEDALQELRLAKSLDLNHVGTRTELGLILVELGKDREAVSEFEIVLRIDPQMVRARVGLCTALARADRLDEAIRQGTEAIRLAPEDAAAFNARGFSHARKGELDRALLDYDQAIRLSPSFAAAFSGRGIVYRRKGDFDRAIHELDQAIRLQPTAWTWWNNRCFTRAIAGLEAALVDCNESLRLQPKSGFALHSRGLTYLKLGHLDRAIADYDAALRIDRKHAHALYGRGLAKGKKGDHTGAEADLAAAQMISPRIAEDYAGYAIDP